MSAEADNISIAIGHLFGSENMLSVQLDEVCSECHGQQMVTSPEWADWNRRWTTAYANAESAEMRATDDAGKRFDPTLRELEAQMESLPGSEEEPCPECEGIGHKPTLVGLLLLAFFDRYRRAK